MGFLDDAKGFLDKIIGGDPPDKGNSISDESMLQIELKKIYDPLADNWYTAKPYGFKFTPRGDTAISFVMFLPISPSNLTITTNFATNIIPTLYGTVEEHSEVRYYDISIEGTTGIAPQYIGPIGGTPSSASAIKSTGRASFPVSVASAAGGFFAQTIGVLQKIRKTATDLYNGAPEPKIGIDSSSSGYMAFHNLYRVLLQYKKDAAGGSGRRGTHPLVFFNYKDNNQYNVAIKSFTMRRSHTDPMLYFYSIQMRGYAISGPEGMISDDMEERYAALGIDGVKDSSLFSKMKSLSGGVKSIVGSLVGGANILGR